MSIVRWCSFCPAPRLAAGSVADEPACLDCGPREAVSLGVEFVPCAVRPQMPQRPSAVKPKVTVRVKRSENGARACRPKKPEAHAILSEIAGSITDREAARRAGVCEETVKAYRVRHGIVKYRNDAERRAFISANNRRRGDASWAKVAPYIGKMTDREVERITGVERSTISAMRKRKGIPAFAADKSHPRRINREDQCEASVRDGGSVAVRNAQPLQGRSAAV